MLIVDLLAVFDFAALIALLALALVNAISLPRLRVPPPSAAPLIHPSADTPLVSILIPARSEANTIAALIRALLAQTYAPFEIILIDEHSSDGTGAIALAAAAGDARLRVIEGQPLLQGWLAANWANHQLAHEANGSVLIFAAADLIWRPDALKAVIALMQRSQTDLLTVWPTPIPLKPGERVKTRRVYPAGFYPVLTTVSGQFLAFRKAAYQAVSGHVAVRDSADTGDVFARLIKAKGLALRQAEGASLIACCGAGGSSAGQRAQDRGHISPLMMAALGLLVFGLPWLWLLAGWWIAGWPLVPLTLVALGLILVALMQWIAGRDLKN